MQQRDLGCEPELCILLISIMHYNENSSIPSKSKFTSLVCEAVFTSQDERVIAR